MFRKILVLTLSLLGLFSTQALDCTNEHMNKICTSTLVEQCYSCDHNTLNLDSLCVPVFAENEFVGDLLDHFPVSDWNCTLYRTETNHNYETLSIFKRGDRVKTLNAVNLRDRGCGTKLRTSNSGEEFQILADSSYDCCFSGCFNWVPIKDSAGRIYWVASELLVLSSSGTWSEYVPIPSGINPGLSSASANYKWMMSTLGSPGCEMSAACFSCGCKLSNDRINSKLVSEDVGPFRVYALRPFVDALTRVFTRVQRDNPSLYQSLSSAGALCCRPIKKSDGTAGSSYSNHSWGVAIDIKIDGELDRRGDGMTQRGLLELSKYMNDEKIWWAAGYVGGAEDAMHFEVSKEALDDWIGRGML